MTTEIGKATATQPPWTMDVEVPEFSTLNEHTRADVCIVGAGIAGLSTAYHLAMKGRSVVLLDDGDLAGGMSMMTTAHLSNAIDDRYVEIERMHGREGAALAALSHTGAIDQIEAIVNSEGIDCDFERLDGYLFSPSPVTESHHHELLKREVAAANRAGLIDVHLLDSSPLDTFDLGPCVRFPNQAQFHPVKFLAGLARAIVREGGRIFTHSHATKIRGGSDAKVIVSNGCEVSCKSIVVATNTPVNDLVTIHTKQAGYMTYAIGARIPKGSVRRALYWDTLQPYHYVRVANMMPSPDEPHQADEHDLLIIGGEDHKTGQASQTLERYAHLTQWAMDRFPMIQSIDFNWAGQVMETIDGLAFIGRNPLDDQNVYIATGDSGMGMTHGTIAGVLLTDLILGHENPWTRLYDPSRKTLGAFSTFLKESFNSATQYVDWVTPGDVSDESLISIDEGAVVRRGLTKVAIYRDRDGVLHELSAVCPHLGGIVQWNAAEKSWDCPCHGSRFDKLGELIIGPANCDLTRVNVDSNRSK